MRIIDAHCDVLYKLWQMKYESHKELDHPFHQDADGLHVTKGKLRKGGVGLQVCAIYLPETVVHVRPFEAALEMVDLFFTELVDDDTLVIRSKEDLLLWRQEGDRLGLMLALEGAEAVGGDLTRLHILHRLGVGWVGLTHNPANLVADGVGEGRGAGLSEFGKRFVRELNRLRIGVDVSHLSEKGFWDVVELSTQPILASHSNAKRIYDHRRNLSDEQIRAIIDKDGVIGVTYVPYFTSGKERVQIEDLIRHIDHICSLGGEDHLGFGSDFDGISQTIEGLEDSSRTSNLVERLLKYYSEEQVSKFMWKNWYHFLMRLWS